MKSKDVQELVVKYDAESIAAIALEIKSQGFLPRSVLDEKFGADKVTQAIAVLYRDFRLFRETKRPWKNDLDATGYEWGDRRFSKSEIKKIPPALGFIVELVSPMSAKYGEFEQVTLHNRYSTPILGSVPVKDKDGAATNVFERDASNRALILPYHQRAATSMGLPMIGKEQSIARRIGYNTIRIPIKNGSGHGAELKFTEHGIVDPSGYGGGKGLRRSEQLVDPIEFTICANVPTTALSIDEFIRLWRTIGQFVRLSPGRSAGFGEFEVLGAE